MAYFIAIAFWDISSLLGIRDDGILDTAWALENDISVYFQSGSSEHTQAKDDAYANIATKRKMTGLPLPWEFATITPLATIYGVA